MSEQNNGNANINNSSVATTQRSTAQRSTAQRDATLRRTTHHSVTVPGTTFGRASFGCGTAWLRARARCVALCALSGGGATSFAGCGSVAGPEYTGEVALELRGEVKSLGEGQQDLVPVLAFLGEDAIHLVEGTVTGEFPTRFTLRVDQAPPESALLTGEFEDSPFHEDAPERAGIALLVLAPPDHADTLPYGILTDGVVPYTSETSEPDPQTGVFTRTDTACSEDYSRCETRVYSCMTEACEPVLEEEVPWSEWRATYGASAIECQGGSCLTYSEECGESSCLRSIAYCETQAGDRPFSDGTIERCTLKSRSGEPVLDGRLASNFARDLVVMFVSEPAEADGVKLEQGYNVMRPAKQDKHRWAEAAACKLDARAEVMNDPRDDSDDELEARIEELQDRCPKTLRLERLANPGDHELQIVLGEANPLF